MFVVMVSYFCLRGYGNLLSSGKTSNLKQESNEQICSTLKDY